MTNKTSIKCLLKDAESLFDVGNIEGALDKLKNISTDDSEDQKNCGALLDKIISYLKGKEKELKAADPPNSTELRRIENLLSRAENIRKNIFSRVR